MKYDIYEAERRANWERERRKSVLLFFGFSFFLLQITISLISYTSDDKIIKRRFLQVATARRANPGKGFDKKNAYTFIVHSKLQMYIDFLLEYFELLRRLHFR